MGTKQDVSRLFLPSLEIVPRLFETFNIEVNDEGTVDEVGNVQ